MRAKRYLVPPHEEPFLGLRLLGGRGFVRGQAPPYLETAGHKLVPILCSEYLSRSLIAQGKAAGGALIAALTSDVALSSSASALRQAMAVLVMRAVEFQLPVVRASRAGYAAFIAPDGRVLAVSESGRSGTLTWSPRHGARDFDEAGSLVELDGEPMAETPAQRAARLLARPPAPPRSNQIVVLYAERGRRLRTRCPAGRCVYRPIDDFRCSMGPAPLQADTVIVAGHAAPPLFLGRPFEEVAAAIRCFQPRLVIIDTCVGSYGPLLQELADGERTPLVVAAPFMLRGRGFFYEDSFFSDLPPAERARAVGTRPELPLFRGRPDRRGLSRAALDVVTMDAAARRQRLRSWDPTLVGVALPEGGEVLWSVDWRPLAAVAGEARLAQGNFPQR
jgi:hypothetical protein